MMRSTLSTSKRLLRGLAAAAFWCLIWQVGCLDGGPAAAASRAGAGGKRLLSMSAEPEFWQAACLTLGRVVAGFSLGAAAGFLLAVCTYHSVLLDVLLAPAVRVVRAAPVASFILLCMLWMKSGVIPAFIAGLMALPIVWENVSQGLRTVDPQLLEMAQLFGMGREKTFFLIQLPSAFGYFRAACVTSMGMAFKSGVAAEVPCQPKQAVGTQLYYSKIYLETDAQFGTDRGRWCSSASSLKSCLPASCKSKSKISPQIPEKNDMYPQI